MCKIRTFFNSAYINKCQRAMQKRTSAHRTNLQQVETPLLFPRYGEHGAFYRFKSGTGRVLPLFYVYDSYLMAPESWAEVLTLKGSRSIRGTPYDGVFVALLVEERHKHDILASGFDGVYTYFASNGFSFGSSHQNWKAIKEFCDVNNLLFVPSVGPGYVDTAVRPWNNHNTRNRVNGRYYDTSLQAALSVRPEIVAVTSFNQWHEGTQIEKAVPKKTVTRLYLDYQPNLADHYLQLTRQWAENFNKEKDKWLM
uniref:Mannosidase endo-alpha like n=1 Tax=Gasterosteus aculeatus aculeatus TaxID=481459 RepID=A0AAQ4PND0_GASAC